MQIFNFLVASLGTAMSVVVFVVVLIYYVYLDVKPELARDLPALWVTAVTLGLIGTSGWFAAALWSKHHPHRWVMEGLTGAALVSGVSLLVAVYR